MNRPAVVTSESDRDVTVVIPTRNRASLLAGALRSALSQVDVAIEVRVIDDGSTDGTAALLAAGGDPRVTVVRHSTPLGVAAARNRAAVGARGRWIAFLDDDDLWAPTWLAAALDAGESRAAGLVYGSRWVVDERRRVTSGMLAEHPSHVRGALADRNSLGGPSAVVVRRDVLRAAGGFDERLSALADWDAWMRILDICDAAPVSDLLTGYTVYPDNMHVRDPFAVLAEFERLAQIVAERSGTVARLRQDVFIGWLAGESARYGHRATAARLWLHSAACTRRARHFARAGLSLVRDRPPEPPTFATPAWLAALAPGAAGTVTSRPATAAPAAAAGPARSQTDTSTPPGRAAARSVRS